jgi:7-cyano-7-deazaguanine synthase in queuosine biosynthesis
VTALDRIAELAKKATPGPWHVAFKRGNGNGRVFIRCQDDYVAIAQVCQQLQREWNAELIAALSPEVVLAMVEVIRAAKEMRVAWKKTETFLGPNKEEKSFDAAISKLEQMK